jgi:undecaprenyl pyrophosphate phosphatase UppP
VFSDSLGSGRAPAAAVLFKLPAILHIPADEVATFVIGVGVSAAVGALTIGGLLAYLRRAGFGIFAVYRVAMGLLIVAVLLVRG